MFVAPQDAGVMDYEHAWDVARALMLHGQKELRVPSGGELKKIFNNKAKIGGFNETGSDAEAGSWYWAVKDYQDQFERIQRFSDGAQGSRARERRAGEKSAAASVRFVRS